MPESGLDFEVIQHLDTNENVVLALDRQHRLKVMAVKKVTTLQPLFLTTFEGCE